MNRTVAAEQYAAMPTDQLIFTLSKERHQYTEAAIELMQKELTARGVEPPSINPAPTGTGRAAPSETRWGLRLVAYAAWLVTWLVVYGGYSHLKTSIIHDFAISGAHNTLDLVVTGSALVSALFFCVLIYGFIFITRKTAA